MANFPFTVLCAWNTRESVQISGQHIDIFVFIPPYAIPLLGVLKCWE